jgi:hypothetical protein
MDISPLFAGLPAASPWWATNVERFDSPSSGVPSRWTVSLDAPSLYQYTNLAQWHCQAGKFVLTNSPHCL